MNKSVKLAVLCLLVAGIFQACTENKKDKNADDDFTSGHAKFVADASFAPIIDEELYVFKSLYDKAKPEVIYKTENECLNLLLNDSIRFAILSRDLSASELKVLKSRTLPPVINKFAVDAVVLIVNQASNDTLITVGDVKKMLNGQTKTDKVIVFDNPNSSLVRYLRDFSGNTELKQKNIYALQSNKEVIKYVSEHPEAIGITGFSWLNDPDKDYAAAVDKVKIVSVKDENSKESPAQYFKPSQSTLALKQYP